MNFSSKKNTFLKTLERRIESITRPFFSSTALKKLEKREYSDKTSHSKAGHRAVDEKRPTLLPFNPSNSLIYLFIGEETLVQFELPKITTS